MFGYIEIRVSDLPIRVWQRIEDGVVIGFVDAIGTPVALPQPCEYSVVSDLVEQLPEISYAAGVAGSGAAIGDAGTAGGVIGK